MNYVEEPLADEWKARLRFEQLVAELSVQFINVSADQLDGAIETAQRRFCEALALDRSSLWQTFGQEPGRLLLTHLYQREPELLGRRTYEKRWDASLHSQLYWMAAESQPGGALTRVDAREQFPWVYEQLQALRPLVISSLGELPAPAAQDREMFRRYGTAATVVVPLAVGGTWLGGLSFASLQQPRHWGPVQLRQFQTIAHLLASTLARGRAEWEGRRAEQKLRQLHTSMRDAFVGLDLSGRIVEFNPAFGELLGYPEAELCGRSHQELTPECWHSLEADIFRNQVLVRGYSDIYEKEYRRRDGRVIPVELRSVLLEGDEPARIWAMVRDITERKLAQEALAKSYAQIKALKDRLLGESDYLRAEGSLSQPHQEIIGRSQALRQVLHLVEQVAPTPTAVLLSGETGTGKELLARAIHRLSSRRDHPMVEVNCAALPETLVESELFGRERGAYTGALTCQVGRFELANGSTIFLDEVGELSLEVQAKLLRVLQEGQFQRLGHPKNHQVDVRVIAASNHDLAAAVQQGRFREDLYYRLNVFPIRVPPLRERVEDIPLLVLAFVEEFSARMGKQVFKVPRRLVEALERYPWPGNIRELRNAIERGVILSRGETLQLSLFREVEPPQREPLTLAEAERRHILKTLEKTGWRIKGPHGAATLLGLKPGTLYSRMRKLGVPHRREKDNQTVLPTPGALAVSEAPSRGAFLDAA